MKKRILLLEDDPMLAETIEELLEDEGYDVSLAYDGDEASELTYREKFDLYLFDINVPEIDGLSLLKALREVDDNTPAIFISALVDIETIAMAFNVGAKDYIKKPFFPEEILIRVNAKFKAASQSIKVEHLEYNPKTKVLKEGEHIISMGDMQLCLFEKFIYNLGRVVDKSELSDCLNQNSSGALRVALNKLKQNTKLDIKNIRGVGYLLETR
jgi:DNA-binding response OmpR family regulator